MNCEKKLKGENPNDGIFNLSRLLLVKWFVNTFPSVLCFHAVCVLVCIKNATVNLYVGGGCNLSWTFCFVLFCFDFF